MWRPYPTEFHRSRTILVITDYAAATVPRDDDGGDELSRSMRTDEPARMKRVQLAQSKPRFRHRRLQVSLREFARSFLSRYAP